MLCTYRWLNTHAHNHFCSYSLSIFVCVMVFLTKPFSKRIHTYERDKRVPHSYSHRLDSDFSMNSNQKKKNLHELSIHARYRNNNFTRHCKLKDEFYFSFISLFWISVGVAVAVAFASSMLRLFLCENSPLLSECYEFVRFKSDGFMFGFLFCVCHKPCAYECMCVSSLHIVPKK